MSSERLQMYEGRFSGANNGNAHVLLFVPVRRDDGVWYCDFEIRKAGQMTSRSAAGHNSLQAIFLAASAIGRALFELSEGLVDEDGLPIWIVFPEMVPISYGKDYYDDIIQYIEKKEAMIGRRRGE
jgi:Domain of unknown function (DUF6968)